jgi:hypothetical protein
MFQHFPKLSKIQYFISALQEFIYSWLNYLKDKIEVLLAFLAALPWVETIPALVVNLIASMLIWLFKNFTSQIKNQKREQDNGSS